MRALRLCKMLTLREEEDTTEFLILFLQFVCKSKACFYKIHILALTARSYQALPEELPSSLTQLKQNIVDFCSPLGLHHPLV